MSTIPRLPNPLTPKTIEGLMNERPYWDTSHPRSPVYHRLVQRGFEIMYPGPTRNDEFGKRIDDPPQPPERIAHLVAGANREMEEMDRAIFGEAASAGGAVHVQSHTRAGGKVEVADYWRARPGEGLGSEPASEAPKARNLLDGAENAEDAQAGTDDGRPKPANPLPDLPKIEIRDDKQGDGRFGTGRERPDGTKYDHEGVDIKAPPGTPVTSPVDGTINRITDAYKSGPLVGQFNAITIDGDDGQQYKFLYVAPKDGDGEILVKNKDRVSAGDPIGTVQDRAAYDRTGKMDNHIHIEIRDASKNIVDPTPHVEEWQNQR